MKPASGEPNLSPAMKSDGLIVVTRHGVHHVHLTRHTEFKTGVTVWSLTEDSDVPDFRSSPSCELQTLCRLIDAPPFSESPLALHGHVDQMFVVSKSDPVSFVSIDLRIDPIDQMEVVGIEVRCINDVADQIEKVLREIQRHSEVTSAFNRGNLGLSFIDPGSAYGDN
jgi:hypothetical protein